MDYFSGTDLNDLEVSESDVSGFLAKYMLCSVGDMLKICNVKSGEGVFLGFRNDTFIINIIFSGTCFYYPASCNFNNIRVVNHNVDEDIIRHRKDLEITGLSLPMDGYNLKDIGNNRSMLRSFGVAPKVAYILVNHKELIADFYGKNLCILFKTDCYYDCYMLKNLIVR